jgi:hypothetical protein
MVFMLQNENEQLELTNEMIERNDEIYNTIQNCIGTLAEKEVEWNMEIIGGVTDAIIDILHNHGIRVRYPGVVTELDGSQHYENYEYEDDEVNEDHAD